MFTKFLIAAFFWASVAYAIDTTTLPDDTGSTDATSDCTDAITGCDKYVNTLCKNTVYSQVMYTQCRSTCGMCDAVEPCVDKNTNCANWNKNGYCTNIFYALSTRKENCAKTCNLCSAAVDVCADVSSSCTAWNKNGFCASASYSADVKKSNCAKTCNLCGTAAAAATTKATTAACKDVNTNCAAWNKNGFCASTAYAAATKKANCANTCKMCP